MISNEVTPSYQKNPLTDMSKKAKLVSVLWKLVGTDTNTKLAAQAMIWKELNRLKITKIKRSDGSEISNLDEIRSKIDQAVTD